MIWRKIHACIIKKLTIPLPFVVIILVSISAHAENGYQYRLLFSPTPIELDAEARGRVMIYEGMNHSTVMRAMDVHFGRIEHMMFVGTVYEQENGELAVEEDGCD